LPEAQKAGTVKVDFICGSTTINPVTSLSGRTETAAKKLALEPDQLSGLLNYDLLLKVERPGQYLGNEWGAYKKSFTQAKTRLSLCFPDLYELGMSNFGQRILYQLVNESSDFMCDRSYAPGQDMEALLRQKDIALWGWESRQALRNFELLGFSLQYELTYTNVLNMLDLSGIPLKAEDRRNIFPLVFGGGPSAVNPEPMAMFMDFFVIGDGERAVLEVMEIVKNFKAEWNGKDEIEGRKQLLRKLASVSGVYVPSLYEERPDSPYVTPVEEGVPARVLRQVSPLTDSNQPTLGLVPYLSLVHDRQVLEVRRGCDRGCRFCQPGYTFLPVRERSTDDLVRLSQDAIKKSGYEEYSMLSLCVSDYTSLHESVRSLNQIHAAQRTSMSFPSQRADRMNLDIAEELKVVRKSGITLAPEAGTERLRAVINKGLKHEQIISAIESAYKSGWTSIKLYYMIGLPTETDEDLDGIVATLQEATNLCRKIKKEGDPEVYKKGIEFTCTISNFVPKPFTPFQWFPQVLPKEFARKQVYLRDKLRASGLRNVSLNCTGTEISLLESVISRGGRNIAQLILNCWKRGCVFDAWDELFKSQIWHEEARALGMPLEEEAAKERPVGSRQPWDIVHVGLADWWLVKEWEKSVNVKETAPCTENTCHACGVCTELDTVHQLAAPKPEVMKKNPFVKELAARVESDGDVHPSLFFEKAPEAPSNKVASRMRIEFSKTGDFKFISHLDLQHLLIRAARRAELQLAYTEGFNPSPKISIALSLPIFAEANAELADIELCNEPDPEELVAALNQQLPADIQITRARKVEKIAPSLATLVGRACYKAQLISSEPAQDASNLNARINELLSATELVIEQPLSEKAAKRASRYGQPTDAVKKKNIRPNIFSIAVTNNDPIIVEFCISHGSREHLKPTEVLKLLVPQAAWQITRSSLLTDDGRGIFEASV
jgi:radical SAM family uncharacterized protein/radical SAM-linked protein